MKKSEKVSIALSAIAIGLSIGIPIASYFLLVPSLREYQLRGRLEVTGARINAHETSPTGAQTYWATPPYEVDVHNVGSLPAKNIQIAIEYPASWFSDLKERGIEANPPVAFTANDTKTQISITQALAPNAHLKIRFLKVPVSIWVLSEAGETSILQTGEPEIDKSMESMLSAQPTPQPKVKAKRR